MPTSAQTNFASSWTEANPDLDEPAVFEFGPQIAACERLCEYAKGLTTSWPGRLIETTAEGLILTLLSRSLVTFMAAVRLASLGYGAQASMLNRSPVRGHD